MNDEQLNKAIGRAQRAANLLADPTLVEAREHIEAELWRQFQRVPPSDTEALQYVAGMRYLHEKYFAFLASAVNDGKLASLEIERRKKTLREKIFG